MGCAGTGENLDARGVQRPDRAQASDRWTFRENQQRAGRLPRVDEAPASPGMDRPVADAQEPDDLGDLGDLASGCDESDESENPRGGTRE